MSRTHIKHWRAYADGVDISGYTRQIGALSWMFDAEPDVALTDSIKNILIGKCEIQSGAINAFLDNDAAGLFALAGTGANDHGIRNVMYAMGANAAPVAGDNVFAWQFEQVAYQVDQGSGFVAASIPFGGASSESTKTYKKPWGKLLHASATRTSAGGINSAIGIDDYGATPPSLGGIFIYHLLSSNGTLTLLAEEADTNVDGSFAPITSATSGSITAAVSPKHGMVALSTSAAIKRYLRPQWAWGTATTAVFVTAFIRNTLAT